MESEQKRKVGLALGAGGARGWAHIGVIKAVRESGIDVHCVAGTSMGALVGAAFASGKIDALHQVALDLDWRRMLYYFLELSLPRAGLIDGARVDAFVKEHVMPTDISDLPMPFAAVATDVLTGAEVAITDGSVTDAVRASIAIPGLLTPFVRKQRVLVDGGLVNPLPVSLARDMGADFVIAVDITRAPRAGTRKHEPALPQEHRTGRPLPKVLRNDGTQGLLDKLNVKLHDFDFTALPAIKKWFTRDELPNIFEIFGNSTRIVQRQITAMRLELDPPDILIQPNIQNISTMEFHRAEDAIAAGYAAAHTVLENEWP